MTPTPEQPDVRELAARAHWAASNGRRLRDDEELPPGRTLHRIHADAIVAAVTPVIRRRALNEVADHLDAVRYWDFGGTRHVRDALAIARSKPAEKESTNG